MSGSRIHFFGKDASSESHSGLEVLGGKGINLFELTAGGFPVPPGFVVSTAAYRGFVEANGIGDQILSLASGATTGSPAAQEEASDRIRELFARSEIPAELCAEIGAAYDKLGTGGAESVAVRSSATAEDLPEASFAGQQDTYLNIRGKEALLKAVRSCWSSLWTARAISYRAQQKIANDDVALAVVVQRMVMAEAAGIMFTANPVTTARDEVVINAAWGLGEAVVGGQVTPDTLVVDKETGRIKDATVAEKTVMTSATGEGTAETEVSAERRNARVLDDETAARLTAVGRDVEAHYASPQDIEWCLCGGELFLVQARPITSLPPEAITSQDIEKVRGEEIDRIRRIGEERGRKVAWAIYNLAETLKAPTPLTWDIISDFMGGSGGFVNMYRDMGYFPSERVNREGILDLIAGRIYADVDRHAELFYDQWPQEYDVETAQDATSMLEGPPTKFNYERAGGKFLLRLPLYIFKMLRQGRRMKRLARKYLQKFEEEVKPRFLEEVERERAKRLPDLSDRELLDELAGRERLFNAIARESEMTSSIAAYYHGNLSSTLEQVLGESAGQALATRLITGLDGDMTVEQNSALHDVSLGRKTLEEFLAAFGHRATEEFELAEPRWYEDASYLQRELENYRRAHTSRPPEPAETHAKQKAERAKAEAKVPALLEANAASSLEDDLRADMLGAQRYMPYRETSKHYYMMAYALIRDAIEEMSRRWELGRDIYFLRRSELNGYADGGDREALRASTAERRIRWRALQRLEMPEFVSTDDPEAIGRPPELIEAEDGLLVGKGLAAGSQNGVARIVHSPKEAGYLGEDYVLVCTSTDPGWTPLFVHARGVIVERGGMLSHGAIVARDFGIPCVALANATKLIPDKAKIKVDGNRGTVELLGTEAAVKEN